MRHPPPRDLDELRTRAHALAGRTLSEIAEELGFRVQGGSVHTKGKVGELVERALGAEGASQALHDFPHLGVELKTLPVDARPWPTESTFVCAFSVAEADTAEWASSWARAKLAHVLWVPVLGASTPRRFGVPFFWEPTLEQEAILRDDFDEIVGRIGRGDVEGVSAHLGRYLQARPKAAHGRVRTLAFGPDGERLDTIPRGFYLRARFTGALLTDRSALPE